MISAISHNFYFILRRCYEDGRVPSASCFREKTFILWVKDFCFPNRMELVRFSFGASKLKLQEEDSSEPLPISSECFQMKYEWQAPQNRGHSSPTRKLLSGELVTSLGKHFPPFKSAMWTIALIY